MFGFEEREFFEVEEPRAGRRPRRSSEARRVLAAVAAARFASRPRRGGEVVRAPRGRRPRAGRGRRLARGRGADHLRVRGPFSGGYRDIPLRDGESISDLSVARGRRALPAAAAAPELGCSAPPGTFGVDELGDGSAIVWHYRRIDEVRTFRSATGSSGLAVAYDDVVDVNLKVWGDEWEQRSAADRDAAPRRARSRARGATRSRCGRRQLDGNAGAPPRARRPGRAVRRAARAVPARRVSPRPPGDGVRRATALAADRRRGACRRGRVRARPRPDRRRARPPPAARSDLLALGLAPGARVRRRVYWLYGRELESATTASTSRSRPPTLKPALVPTLARARADTRRLVRVHGHALRPDPARALQGEAGHDRASRLGRPAHARRSPTSSSRRASDST